MKMFVLEVYAPDTLTVETVLRSFAEMATKDLAGCQIGVVADETIGESEDKVPVYADVRELMVDVHSVAERTAQALTAIGLPPFARVFSELERLAHGDVSKLVSEKTAELSELNAQIALKEADLQDTLASIEESKRDLDKRLNAHKEMQSALQALQERVEEHVSSVAADLENVKSNLSDVSEGLGDAQDMYSDIERLIRGAIKGEVVKVRIARRY